MKARDVIKLSMILSVACSPSLFRKPSAPFWIVYFIINGLMNHFFDSYLVKSRRLKYPVRFAPKIFKINFIYDYLICPYISIWYCQATYHDNLKKILLKSFLFGIPQALFEIWAESSTKLLRFNKRKWSWLHSTVIIFFVKFLVRAMLEPYKKISKDRL